VKVSSDCSCHPIATSTAAATSTRWSFLGTIPLGAYVILHNVKKGVGPWISWENARSNYSRVKQVPNFLWKADPGTYNWLEMFRWSIVACALLFFAFFGFADEVRRHYRLVYTSLASRIGISTAGATLHESYHAYLIGFNLVTSSRRTSLSSACRLSLT